MMKKTFTLFLALTAATASFAFEEAEAPEIEQVAMIEAAVPTGAAGFGYCTAAIGNTGKFAVSAGSKAGNANSRFVDIYSFDEDGNVVKEQTINEPAEGAGFFGYLIAASEDVLVVWATTPKKFYFYKAVDGVFENEPFVDYTTSFIANGLKVEGNTFVYTGNGGGVHVLEIDKENGTLTEVFTDEETGEGKVCAIDLQNGVLVVMFNEKGIAMYKEVNDVWSQFAFEETPHGMKNNSEAICMYDGIIYAGMSQCIYAFFEDDGGYVGTSDDLMIEGQEGKKLDYGASVRTNGKYLVNLSKAAKPETIADYGYVYKLDENGEWQVFGRINPQTNGVKDKVMSACFVGNRLIYANNTHKSGDITSAGCFYVFDFGDKDSGEGQGVVSAERAKNYDVYRLNSELVKQAKSYAEAIEGLPRGIYVIGGRVVGVK